MSRRVPHATRPADVGRGIGEEELLQRIARGDEAALVALYERVGPLVYACCTRILQDEAEAGDTASETFWRLWCRASSYDPDHCSAKAWILTIARRLALDRRRSLMRRSQMLIRFRVQPRMSNDPVEKALAQIEITNAFERLSGRDRDLLESAYFDGLSGADIAARDGIPLGTVKSRMRAALARLRLLLQGARP